MFYCLAQGCNVHFHTQSIIMICNNIFIVEIITYTFDWPSLNFNGTVFFIPAKYMNIDCHFELTHKMCAVIKSMYTTKEHVT